MDYQKLADKLSEEELSQLNTDNIPHTFDDGGKYAPEFIEYLLKKEGKMQ